MSVIKSSDKDIIFIISYLSLKSNGRFPNRTIEGGVCAVLLSLIDFLPEQAKCLVFSSSAVLFNKSCSYKLLLCWE